MKKPITLAALGLALITTASFAQENVSKTAKQSENNQKTFSLREILIEREQTAVLIAIDDHHSHVFPNVSTIGLNSYQIPSDFTEFIINSCDTKWQIKGFDPLTSKINWVPYDGKGSLYTREIEDKITKNKEIVNGARCVDRFEIIEVWGKWRSLFSDGTGRYFSPLNFIIKHNTVQPFKYKNNNIPENVTMLPDGEVKSLNPEATAKKGFFSKLLSSDKPSSADLYQYSKVLCDNLKGKVRTVANEGIFVADPKGTAIKDNIRGYWKDALFEESAIDVYRHLYAGGYSNTNLEKEWYLACEGDSSFIVRERENITFGARQEPISKTSTYFAVGRGLDGVEFSKK